MNILKAVTFESFLAKKYGTEKRFGLEGCEAFIPAMEQCIETCAENGLYIIINNLLYYYLDNWINKNLKIQK